MSDSVIGARAQRTRKNDRALAGIAEYLQRENLTGHLLLHCKDGVIAKLELRNVVKVGDPLPSPLPSDLDAPEG